MILDLDMRVRLLGLMRGLRVHGWVELRLYPRLHHIERACDDTSDATCTSTRYYLQSKANLFTINPLLGQFLFLFVHGKL